MKRIGILCLAFLLLVSILPWGSCAGAEASSGIHGGNISWKFDPETGTLTFTGTGDMELVDINPHLWVWRMYPWYTYHDRVTNVVIGEGITSIADSAFENFYALETVSLPQGLKSIGAFSFYGCEALERIVLPEGLEQLGEFIFLDCPALETVELPGQLSVIPAGMFRGCAGLKEICLPSGVRAIGEQAFSGCESLTSVALPQRLETIGEEAFFRCTGLRSVSFRSGALKVDGTAFFGCSLLLGIWWYSWVQNGMLQAVLVQIGVLGLLCALWMRSAGKKQRFWRWCFWAAAAAAVAPWCVYVQRIVSESLDLAQYSDLYRWVEEQEASWSPGVLLAMEYVTDGSFLILAVFGVGAYRYFLTGELLRRCDRLAWGEGIARCLIWLEGFLTVVLWVSLAYRDDCNLVANPGLLSLWMGNLLGLLSVLCHRRGQKGGTGA